MFVFLLGMENYSSFGTRGLKNRKKEQKIVTLAPFLVALLHPAKYNS